MEQHTLWLPVVGYEGLYEVSEAGDVRRLAASSHRPANWVVSTHTVRGNYRQIHVADASGLRKQKMVHRLVAEAFLGPALGREVRHLDGDPTNNRLSNLRWGTHSENEFDKVAHGNHKEARKTHCPRNHPYSGANLRLDYRGYRICRACERIRARLNKLRLTTSHTTN